MSKVKLYWPVAEYKQTADTQSVYDGLEVFQKLWTYSPCDTMAEARDVISKWANDCNYHLTKAWINCEFHEGERKTKRRVTVF